MAKRSPLASFFSYPLSSAMCVKLLVEAGFHYCGHGDAVICHLCGLKYAGWQKDDNPTDIHRINSPACPLFRTGSPAEIANNGDSTEEQNVIHYTHQQTGTATSVTSTRSQETEAALETAQSATGEQRLDVTDNFTNSENPVNIVNQSEEFSRTDDIIEVASNSNQRRISSDSPSGTPVDSASCSDTIILPTATETLETTLPKYQQFAILASRLQSYRGWPDHLNQRPHVLAKAGLFYEGGNDHVRCFHCGGGLREWEPEDDPFYEHARWFPFCPFLRLTKGDKFIMGVQSGTLTPSDVREPVPSPHKEADVLEHPAVLSLIEMGYTKTIITKAIPIYRTKYGLELHAEKLLSVVWEMEENDNNDNDEGNDDKKPTKNEETPKKYESKINESDKLMTKTEYTNQDIEVLTEENRELREQKICKVCLDEDASIVFLPCGHLVTCPMCASALRKCPVCRTYIRGTVKAIVS